MSALVAILCIALPQKIAAKGKQEQRATRITARIRKNSMKVALVATHLLSDTKKYSSAIYQCFQEINGIVTGLIIFVQ